MMAVTTMMEISAEFIRLPPLHVFVRETRPFAKRFDLSRGLDAGVCRDLLQHADALLELIRARRVLRRFLGHEPALAAGLLLATVEETVRNIEDRRARKPTEDKKG